MWIVRAVQDINPRRIQGTILYFVNFASWAGLLLGAYVYSVTRLEEEVLRYLLIIYLIVFSTPIFLFFYRMIGEIFFPKPPPVLPVAEEKLRPDIDIVGNVRRGGRTQADILAEQRNMAKKLHGLSNPINELKDNNKATRGRKASSRVPIKSK